MDKIYRNLIIKKLRTIDVVTDEKLKEQVLELLKVEGYDGYGEPLVK